MKVTLYTQSTACGHLVEVKKYKAFAAATRFVREHPHDRFYAKVVNPSNTVIWLEFAPYNGIANLDAITLGSKDIERLPVTCKGNCPAPEPDEDKMVGDALARLNDTLKRVGATWVCRVEEDGQHWYLISEGVDEHGAPVYSKSAPNTQMGVIKRMRLITVHLGGSLSEPIAT